MSEINVNKCERGEGGGDTERKWKGVRFFFSKLLFFSLKELIFWFIYWKCRLDSLRIFIVCACFFLLFTHSFSERVCGFVHKIPRTAYGFANKIDPVMIFNLKMYYSFAHYCIDIIQPKQQQQRRRLWRRWRPCSNQYPFFYYHSISNIF